LHRFEIRERIRYRVKRAAAHKKTRGDVAVSRSTKNCATGKITPRDLRVGAEFLSLCGLAACLPDLIRTRNQVRRGYPNEKRLLNKSHPASARSHGPVAQSPVYRFAVEEKLRS